MLSVARRSWLAVFRLQLTAQCRGWIDPGLCGHRYRRLILANRLTAGWNNIGPLNRCMNEAGAHA